MVRFNKLRKNIVKRTDNLCEPAMLYLILSVAGLILLGIQNTLSGSRSFCLAKYQCSLVDKTTAFMVQLFYILFWTWLLNFMCKKGFKKVSWFIVLLPFLLYLGVVVAAVSMGIFVSSTKEGMPGCPSDCVAGCDETGLCMDDD